MSTEFLSAIFILFKISPISASPPEHLNSSEQNAHLRFIYTEFLEALYDPNGIVRRDSVQIDEHVSSQRLTDLHPYHSTLLRVRRQERLLCLGNDFVTSFINKLIEANRQSLKDWEPINMGDAINIGIMDLKRGKAYGIANIFLQGHANVDCKIDPTHVAVELPMGIRDIRIVYDYSMPFALYFVSGQAQISFTVRTAFTLPLPKFQLLGVNVTLYLPRNRKLDFKPYVKKVVVWSTRGFNMNLNGAGPATAALGLVFNLLSKVSPMVIEQFMSSLFVTVGGKLLQNANLPL